MGDQLIAVGFSMGSCLTDNCDEWLTGPIVVTDNTISGNVTFGVALAGFTDGLTVSVLSYDTHFLKFAGVDDSR